ncbi:MAG: signal peptidase [Gaiellaceae bacterium]|jgi:signal peptidase I|nr:signal peptidase [Gaiellaceae bacterium]
MITRIGRWTVSLVSGLAVLLVVFYAALMLLGLRPAAVYSGSMEPKLHVGSLVVVRPVAASTLKVGDIITFNDPYVAKRLVTHRIVRIVERPQGRAYRTKGDANPARDPWAIELPAKVGKYSFDVPFVGYALVYARTREIRTLLVLLASLALLGALLQRIWRTAPVPSPS